MGTSADILLLRGDKRIYRHNSHDGHVNTMLAAIASSVAEMGLDVVRQAVDAREVKDPEEEFGENLDREAMHDAYVSTLLAAGKTPSARALNYDDYAVPYTGLMFVFEPTIENQFMGGDSTEWEVDLDLGELRYFTTIENPDPAYQAAAVALKEELRLLDENGHAGGWHEERQKIYARRDELGPRWVPGPHMALPMGMFEGLDPEALRAALRDKAGYPNDFSQDGLDAFRVNILDIVDQVRDNPEQFLVAPAPIQQSGQVTDADRVPDNHLVVGAKGNPNMVLLAHVLVDASERHGLNRTAFGVGDNHEDSLLAIHGGLSAVKLMDWMDTASVRDAISNLGLSLASWPTQGGSFSFRGNGVHMVSATSGRWDHEGEDGDLFSGMGKSQQALFKTAQRAPLTVDERIQMLAKQAGLASEPQPGEQVVAFLGEPLEPVQAELVSMGPEESVVRIEGKEVQVSVVRPFDPEQANLYSLRLSACLLGLLTLDRRLLDAATPNLETIQMFGDMASGAYALMETLEPGLLRQRWAGLDADQQAQILGALRPAAKFTFEHLVGSSAGTARKPRM